MSTRDKTAPIIPETNHGETKTSKSLIRLLVINQFKIKYAAAPIKKPKTAKVVKILVLSKAIKKRLHNYGGVPPLSAESVVGNSGKPSRSFWSAIVLASASIFSASSPEAIELQV